MLKTRHQFTPECVLDIISGWKRSIENCNENQISDALLSIFARILTYHLNMCKYK